MCACTHTYTYESIHTSLFRIVIIELHMSTARCSVQVVKHEPIDSQRVQFQMLFSVAVQKSLWTVEFEQMTQDFVICESQKPAVPRDY